jgi:hypothetical protein
LVINDLNENGSRKLEMTGVAGGPPYIDVNGDGYVAPLDAVQVINALNNRSAVGATPTELPDLPENPAEGELGSRNGEFLSKRNSTLRHAWAEIGDRIRSVRDLESHRDHQSVSKSTIALTDSPKDNHRIAAFWNVNSRQFLNQTNRLGAQTVNGGESIISVPPKERRAMQFDTDAIDAAFSNLPGVLND